MAYFENNNLLCNIHGIPETINQSTAPEVTRAEWRDMSGDELKMIREWIIWHIMCEPKIMHEHAARDITVYSYPGEMTNVDLVGVIASLYEVLHFQVTGEPYDYMWHWANKTGSWVNDKLFMEMLREAVEGGNNHVE